LAVASEAEGAFGFALLLGVRRDHPHTHELVAMPKNPTEELGGLDASNAEWRHF